MFTLYTFSANFLRISTCGEALGRVSFSMAIPEGAIYSEDGQYVIGVRERKDRYGNILPESEWMYKKKIPVKNMQQLVAGKQTPEQAAKARETAATTVEDKVNRFLGHLEHGLPRSVAARKADLAKSYIFMRMREDPMFKGAVRDAESVADEQVLDVVWKSIVVDGNVQAGIKWLEKRNPDWADKRVTETTVTNRLEIDASDRVASIAGMLGVLAERKALAEGNVIDVKSVEIKTPKARNKKVS